VHPQAARRLRGLQPLAQPAVGADAAGHHERREARAVERGERLGHQHVDDRRLHAGGQVGARLLVGQPAAHVGQHRGLEAGEAEVEIVVAQLGPRQRDGRPVADSASRAIAGPPG
jgi:hypothetical protein